MYFKITYVKKFGLRENFQSEFFYFYFMLFVTTIYLIPNAVAITKTIPINPKNIVEPALGSTVGNCSVSLTFGVTSELFVLVLLSESV